MPGERIFTPHNISYVGDAYPSFWSLIHDRIGGIVTHAVQGSKSHIKYSKETMGSFTNRVSDLLDHSFQTVPFHPDKGESQELHRLINTDVKNAVDEAMHELHMEEETNSTFKEDLVKTLDANLEMTSFNRLLANSTGLLGDATVEGAPGHSFQEMPVKDETVFIALVCMAVIVPLIFISIFVLFLYKKQKDSKERREAMLLQDQPEFSMDDYPSSRRSDEELPDLELKNLRV